MEVRDLVDLLVRSVVEDPEAVEVEEVEEDGELIYEVSVGDDDIGRVIGRSGRVVQALRTIARAAGADEAHRVTVEILD